MPKVSKRGGFSDRNSIKPENVEIQLKDFDRRTRVQLQNMASQFYSIVFGEDLYYTRSYIQDFLKYILGTVYSEPIDTRSTYLDDPVIDMINNTILNDEYDDVLTLIESLVQYFDSHYKKHNNSYFDKYSRKYNGQSFYDIANMVFEREYIGYRFVDEIIVPISDPCELKTIQETLNNKHKVIYEHISKANKYLADRNDPDYENSIKESISAVEAICKMITGMTGNDANLTTMIKHLDDKGVFIHRSLKSAFITLYSYTSDAKGIRHAGDIGGPASTFGEAKFMLVSCCAFINYLMDILSKNEINSDL